MKAANGTGIISTAVMESDDLDEIDWVRLYPLTPRKLFPSDLDYGRGLNFD